MMWGREMANIFEVQAGYPDYRFNYEETKWYVAEHGIDEFIREIQDAHPSYDIGQISIAWLDDHKFICKAHGNRGDITIGWER
ncbi:hypothetical protein [Mechercharimyces sp. CAU 1602]|uniref:hypothetical protein n=1 Tax=Mechercharimyces sp. CAU 1602 TaxID=2973933 RepID=UPI002161A30A|nr:hypothetical protein [Mechercharimyces sp. CAU 1602]MCS1350338.1 hypothetical protein [Mechercharimyces sp. CAU 1602]